MRGAYWIQTLFCSAGLISTHKQNIHNINNMNSRLSNGLMISTCGYYCSWAQWDTSSSRLADITPGSEPLCQWQGRTKPPRSEPPVELEHNVRCRFMLQERVFWKLNFRGFWTRGLCPGVYVRQSWNFAFKSAMCDSVGFIRPCHWTGDSDLGGLCPRGCVRGVMSGHRHSRYVHWQF